VGTLKLLRSIESVLRKMGATSKVEGDTIHRVAMITLCVQNLHLYKMNDFILSFKLKMTMWMMKRDPIISLFFLPLDLYFVISRMLKRLTLRKHVQHYCSYAISTTTRL